MPLLEVVVPTGPGSGLIIDPDFISKQKIATNEKSNTT